MSTKHSHLVVLLVRVRHFPIFVVFPFRCLDEVLEGATDILCLFEKISRRVSIMLSLVQSVLLALRTYGPLDLVDVDVHQRSEHVTVKILMR